MIMSKKNFLMALSVAFFGCTSPKDSDVGEGEEEFDPGIPEPDEPASDPDEEDPVPDDGDTGDSGEEEIVVPESAAEVCYPGLSNDYSMCFPLVDHVEEMGESYDYPEPLDGSAQYEAPVRYIDLRAIDHSLPLSLNFVFSEFMHKDKGPFGLYQVHAVENLQAIREATGGPLYANSGYRNVTYNEGVGGAEWSRHLYGDAMDMRSDTVSLSELAEICEDFGAGFTKLYDSHVHCDWRDDPLDEAFFE